MAENYAAPPNAEEAKTPETESPDDVGAFIREALSRYEAGYDKDRDNILEAYDDLKFLAAKGDDQWDGVLAANRRADQRPVLTINRLGTFHAQVANDIRAGKPSIQIIPVDDQGDVKTAEVRGDMIRYIENRSDAKYAYAAGCESQTACGIGHWKIVREYAGTTTFAQELRIVPIENQIGVVWDPESVLPTREDANWCFEPVDMGRDAFKTKYPDAKFSDWSNLDYECPQGWWTDDTVRVVRYWLKKPFKRTLALLPGGSVEDITEPFGAETPEEFQARVTDIKMAVAQAQMMGNKYVRIEKRDSFKVCNYLLTAAEILDKKEWPGLYIPVIPILGKEIKFGREVVRFGLVRFAKDPQRLYNYMRSAQAESTALQPKSPFLATQKNVEAFQAMWQTANSSNHPVLLYEPDPANGSVPPQRIAPPIASTAWTEQVQYSSQELKDVTGIYDASLGNKSNETSGVAIRTRERQGDTATMNYGETFALAIGHTGRVLNDLIPHVYDTERTVRIVGEDGRMNTVRINKPPMTDGVNQLPPTEQYNPHDMSIGSYDIVIKSGPGFSTRREESREMILAFIQAYPQAAPLVIDLFAEMQDWPGAQKLRERLEATLPPAIQMKLAAERGEQYQPPPPSPDQQVAMAEAQSKGAVADGRVKEKQTEIELKNIELEIARTNLAAAIAKATAAEAGADAAEAKAGAAHVTAAADVAEAANGEGGPKNPASRTKNAASSSDLAEDIAKVKAMVETATQLMAEMHLNSLSGPQPPVQ